MPKANIGLGGKWAIGAGFSALMQAGTDAKSVSTGRPKIPKITPAKSCARSIGALTNMKPKMKTYEFCVVASGLDPDAEDFESRFYDAGCDDAAIAFQRGRIIADFDREAETLEEAIATAVEAVTKAGAKVIRIEPDPLVSLADMAGRSGLTRAAMTNYSKGKRGENFPPPVAKATSESPLWEWASVARWLYEHRKIGREVAIAAETFRQANEAVRNGEVHIRPRLKQRAKQYAIELNRERSAA